MKIACLGDLHLTGVSPVNRTDDYPLAQYKKMEFILDWCLNNGVSVIAIAGDIFDKHNTPYWVVGKYIQLFNKYTTPHYANMNVVATWGQHDVRYHTSDIKNTPLGVLCEGVERFQLVNGDTNFCVRDDDDLSKVVMFHGAAWGEDIVPADTTDEKAIQVLLTHRMVIKDAKSTLWPGQEGFTTPRALFKYGYDLVVSGDNHQRFICQDESKHVVVNPGCLSRNRLDLESYQPKLTVWSSGTMDHGSLDIPVEQGVFAAKGDDGEPITIDTLVSSFAEATLRCSDFAGTVQRMAAEANLTDSQSTLLKGLLNDNSAKADL